MANYANLKSDIIATIRTNGNNEITGALLQQNLVAMINSLGVGFQFMGIATPNTNPGTPDQNVFYLASAAGTYVNFGGIELQNGEVAILKYNGAWTKDTSGFGSQEAINRINELIQMSEVVDVYLFATRNLRPTATTIVTDAGGYTYIAQVKSGEVLTVNFSMSTGNYLRYGFTTVFPELGTQVTGYNAAAASATRVVLTAPADGYLILESSNAFLSLSVTKPANGSIGETVYIDNLKVARLMDAAFRPKQVNATEYNGIAFTLTVNSAPSQNANNAYRGFRAQNLQYGDSVAIIARAGSSYATYGLLKNGIVIWASATYQNVNETIVCDGSFDEIVVNNYTGAVANPSCVITYLMTPFGYIDELDGRLTTVENNVNIESQRTITGVSGRVFGLTVGNAPVQNSASGYISCVADGLKEGDVVHVIARSGSSYPTYGLVKNGVVVWASAALLSMDDDIICDGSFDEIICNSYSSYVANPTLVVTSTMSPKEYADELNENTNERIDEIEQQVQAQTLRILVIGNSFSEDSFSYIPGIYKKIYPSLNLVIGIGYIGGSPLAQHYSYFTGQQVTLDDKIYRVNNGQYERLNSSTQALEWSGLYTFYKSSNGGAWTNGSAKTIEQILADEEWDVVTFQQAGGTAQGDFEIYYAPYIFGLQKSLFAKINYPTRLGWVLIHGSYATNDAGFLAKWQGAALNAEKVMDLTGASILFPYGTAIQNLRTTSLKNLGDGSGHNLTVDNAHLQEGIGPLAAAYTNLIVIVRSLGKANGVIGETTRPNAAFLTQINAPGQNVGTGVIGISDANCFLAQIAAEKAVTNPYEVTDLTVYE